MTNAFNLLVELGPYFSSAYNMSDDPLQHQGAYVRLDARLGINSADGHWGIDVIGKNMTDRQIYTSIIGSTRRHGNSVCHPRGTEKRRSAGAVSLLSSGCNMKLATFTESNRTRIGVVEGDQIIDPVSTTPALADMISLLEAGPEGMSALRNASTHSRKRYSLESVRLEAPVMRPRKFLNLGGSYRSHVAEVAHLGIKPPAHQTWTNKQVTCVNGPFDAIHFPTFSDSMDYEGELAIVIGRRCRNVTASTVQDVVAGYLICNDVSIREWQLRSPTAMLGKSFDTHGPIGPWLVTPDELAG